jgi:hypothetical protein
VQHAGCCSEKHSAQTCANYLDRHVNMCCCYCQGFWWAAMRTCGCSGRHTSHCWGAPHSYIAMMNGCCNISF